MAQGEASVLFNSLSGKAGSVVFVHGKHGIVVRPRTVPANPRTPGQTGARSALAHASAVFSALNPSQARQWETYGASLSTPLSGCAAFTQLGAKLLQVSSSATLPTTPPTQSFLGDNVSITATGGAGQVTFTASAPNGVSVQTEMLVQRLARPNRKPGKSSYRMKGFKQFVSSSLSLNIPLAPGTYSCAFRFMQGLTGQQTPMVVVGTVTVS